METAPRIKLNNGVEIPSLGFGTYKIPPGKVTEDAVSLALAAGYRHIDTAKYYANEESVGKAVRESGIPRDEVFVTTKLWLADQAKPETSFERSKKLLGLGTVDLYLIHWPVPLLRQGAWKALEKLYKKGEIRAIGVSNYTIKHLEQLLADTDVVPAVNQIEFTPFLYQKELLEYCKKKGIAVEAYSPLSRGRRLDDQTIAGIAKKHKKSYSQIVLRWDLQHGVIPLPKSVHAERIRENNDVFGFELDRDDMAALDSKNENYRCTSVDPNLMP